MKIPIVRNGSLFQIALQDDLTDRDIVGMQDDLLRLVHARDAHGVLIDLSALAEIDEYLSAILTSTAAMVQVLGCRIVLCGIQPRVALRLLEFDTQLDYLRTAINLEQGARLLGPDVGR